MAERVRFSIPVPFLPAENWLIRHVHATLHVNPVRIRVRGEEFEAFCGLYGGVSVHLDLDGKSIVAEMVIERHDSPLPPFYEHLTDEELLLIGAEVLDSAWPAANKREHGRCSSVVIKICSCVDAGAIWRMRSGRSSWRWSPA
jgi:hypothetical protein